MTPSSRCVSCARADSTSKSTRVRTFAAFQESLARATHALILSDYTVPGVDVLKALQLARQMRPEVPFVFLAGTLGEDTAIETLKMGATDCVLKQRIARLVPAVRRALQEAEDQLRRKQAEADLRKAYTLLRAVTEGVAEAIFVTDDQGRYLMINAAGVRRLGKTSPANLKMQVSDSLSLRPLPLRPRHQLPQHIRQNARRAGSNRSQWAYRCGT